MKAVLHHSAATILLQLAAMPPVVVKSFSPNQVPTSRTNQRHRQLCLFEEYMSEDYNPNPSGQKPRINESCEEISYGIGGVDLSKRWMELVGGDHVTAVTELTEDDDDNGGIHVRYGVRLQEKANQDINEQQMQQQRLMEFAEILPDQSTEAYPNLHEHVTSINATLKEMQQKSNGMAIDSVYDGPYAIQLQLVRTLRPKRSKDMSSKKSESQDAKPSCQPPAYDASKDSFLVGPLRLFGHGEFHGEGKPRERAAQIVVPKGDADSGTPYDIFHNISPVDPRGHFLLLPDISDEKQWRDQSLIAKDCYDLTYLASTIQPRGSVVLSFNSVSAGASQNHIHSHAWLNPPPPLQYRNDPTAEYDSVYAVTKATSIASLNLKDGVAASLLKYPCTCVKLSVTTAGDEHKVHPSLKEMGSALFNVVQVAQKMQVPHNVVWMNSAAQNDETRIDVYVFFRANESVELDNGTFRLGSSELLGVFHATSKEQMFSVKKYKGLSCYGVSNVLSDVSYEPREHVWAEISNALGGGGKKISRRLQALQKAELYKKENK